MTAHAPRPEDYVGRGRWNGAAERAFDVLDWLALAAAVGLLFLPLAAAVVFS